MVTGLTPLRNPLPLWVIVVLWILLPWAAYVIDQTFRWTDHAQGFANGVIHIWILGIGSLCYGTPWLLAIWGLYRWRGWRKYRTAWMLAPPVAMALYCLGVLIVNPPTPARQFQSSTNVKFPKNVQNLHWAFSGGGFDGSVETYYFRTSPEEIGRLIMEMDLDFDGSAIAGNTSRLTRLPGAPDPAKWPGVVRFSGQGTGERSGWGYELLTDATRTQVYISIMST